MSSLILAFLLSSFLTTLSALARTLRISTK